MKKSLTIGCLLALAAIFLVVCRPSGEPKYQGRTLTSWLGQYSDTSFVHTQRVADAQTAIRAMDSAKVLPKLLEFIHARDSRFTTWLRNTAEEHELPLLHGRSAEETRALGVAGFEILRTNAAPAVDRLNHLLDDKDHALIAVECLDHIGKPSEAALCRCLTNHNWKVRQLAVYALAGATEDVEVYIARVKDRLNDSQEMVRLTTVSALGWQTNAPEIAVPLLANALNDTNDNVSVNAAHSLSTFGTNAAPAFPTLTNLLSTRGAGARNATMKAMVAIDPPAALTILSNLVVNGPANQVAPALQTMETIAPEQSHTLTVTASQSPQAARRMGVLSVLKRRDPLPPGFAEALKSAAADSDPAIAKRAKMTIRWIVQTRNENLADHLQLPGEPSYQGHPLGEWIESRQTGGELSTNTINALRQMGTNVVPFLVARITYRDPEFGSPDPVVSLDAAKALIALGDLTKPALPVLTTLMDGDEQVQVLPAMLATLGTGTNAVPCLIKGLTNQFPEVRTEAQNILEGRVTRVPK